MRAMVTVMTSQGFCRSVANFSPSIGCYSRRCATRRTRTISAARLARGNVDADAAAKVTTNAAAAAVAVAAAADVAVWFVVCYRDVDDAGNSDDVGDNDIVDNVDAYDEISCEYDRNGREPRSLMIRALPRRRLLVLLFLPKQVRGPVREVEYCEYDGKEDP